MFGGFVFPSFVIDKVAGSAQDASLAFAITVVTE